MSRYRTVDVAVTGGDLRVGVWDASTGDRDPASDAGKFMSDAATAYSAFALSAR